MSLHAWDATAADALAPIRYVQASGSHGFLRAWYRNVDSVTISGQKRPRQYVQHGNTLLAFIHGDKGSPQKWVGIIANEAREMWGACEHRIVFCGHLHTERQFPTYGGLHVVRMPSLAGSDRWHRDEGSRCSSRVASARKTM